MKIRRRDFLKGVAGSGVLTAIGRPAWARDSKKSLPKKALGILIDTTLCVGCQVCVTACKQANNMPIEHTGVETTWDNPHDLSAKTLNIIKRYEEGSGEVKNRAQDGYAFVKRHCMHCVDPGCVSACPVSALTKSEVTGIVSYNEKACIGCRYCQVACPFNIPKFEWTSVTPVIKKCQLCDHLISKGGISACCAACPTGASLFGPVDKLLEEAERRLDMTPGEYYDFPVGAHAYGAFDEHQKHQAAKYIDKIYGETEVGGTQVLLLSGIPFDRLGLPELPDESFAALSDGIQYAIYKGMVYPLVVLGGLIYMVRRREDENK